MGVQKLLLISFLVELLGLISLGICQLPHFRDYRCVDTNDTDTYKNNLGSVFSSMTSDTQIDYGFNNFSVGQEPDRANGIALCRGDVSLEVCRECIRNATTKLLLNCPGRKEAVGWYDLCMLRYSNRSIFGVSETLPRAGVYVTNTTDMSQFNQVLGDLLSSLKDQAASGNSQLKFAANEAKVDDFETIYALAQCTPDLSKIDCVNCLQVSIAWYPQCCLGKDVTIFAPSCHLKFDTDLFYDLPGESPPSLPPSSLVSPPSNGN